MKTLINTINPSDLDQPMVFVTTYGLYNEGRQFANNLTGFWISCDDYVNNDREIFDNFVNQGDPDPEIMFTDYQSFPESLYCESGIDFDLIDQWYSLDDNEKACVDAYCKCVVNDVKTALENINEMGIFTGTLGDYARDITEGGYEIPKYLENYIDYDAMGRDISIIDGGVYEISCNKLLVVQF